MADPRRIQGWPLFGSALPAPALCWTVFAVSAAVTTAPFALTGELFGYLLMFAAIAGLVALWGLIPAAAIGAATLFGLGKLPQRWASGAVAHALAGGLAAAIYCAVGIGLAHHASSLAFLIAPWASVALSENPSILPRVVASIVIGGALSCLLYHRLAQRG